MRCAPITSVVVFRPFSEAQAVELVISAREFSDSAYLKSPMAMILNLLPFSVQAHLDVE